jgi:hypothetical protein
MWQGRQNWKYLWTELCGREYKTGSICGLNLWQGRKLEELVEQIT